MTGPWTQYQTQAPAAPAAPPPTSAPTPAAPRQSAAGATGPWSAYQTQAPAAPAAPAAPRRAPTGGGRQPAPAPARAAPAAPAAPSRTLGDSGLTLGRAVVEQSRQGYGAQDIADNLAETFGGAPADYSVIRSEDITPQEAQALIDTGEYQRDPRDPTKIFRVVGTIDRPAVELPAAEVQGGVEGLPMVRPAGSGGPLEQAGAAVAGAYRANPITRQFLNFSSGAARGVQRVAGGAYGLLGQAADRLGLDGIGNAMINQADAYQARANEMNAQARADNLRLNQAAQVFGEVAATAPVGVAAGSGIRVVGQGVGRFAPPVGRGIEAFGRSVAAGGFTPSAVGRPAAGMAPSGLERLGNVVTRAGGGATAGALGTALTAPGGGEGDSGLLGMSDTEAGAAIGALLPTVAARPAKFAMNRLMDGYQALVGELGQTRAANIVRQSLGVDYDAALVALRNARPDETAQQALVRAGVEPAAFMGVGAEVRAAAPDAYLAIEAAQQAAMQAPINRLAGGANLTAAQLTQRAEKQALRAATVPAGEAALARAGATGRLDVDAIANQLMARADVPGVRANPELVQALAIVARQLRSMADLGGGVIEPADLYQIRQRFITSEVNKLLNTSGTASPSALRAQEAEIRANIAPLIDDAIEAAGGTGWRQYLDDYSSGMRSVERQQMLGVAGRQLRQNPNTFANLVEGDAPDVVANVFNRNDTLANLMNPTGVGPSGMDALTSAAQQIRRNQRVDVLAGEGRGAAQELIRQGRNRGPLSGVVDLAARIFRPGTAAAMQVGSALLDAKIAPQVRTALAQAYQSGASMMELLAMTPLADRAQVARNLQNPAFWAHLQTGAINAMTGNGEQPNTMSPPPQ
jgi:hypothetical protein